MAVPNNKRGFSYHQSGAEEYIEEEKTISMFKVMICNVFVCNVWKAAGLFAEISDKVFHPLTFPWILMHVPLLQINCGETSVNDNYRLAHYRSQKTKAFDRAMNGLEQKSQGYR